MTPTFTQDLTDCWTLCRRGESVVALARGLELWKQAKMARDEAAVAAASERIAWFCFQLGDTEAGIEHAYAAVQIFAATGDARREAGARSVYAWLLLEAGLTEEAADEAFKAVTGAEQVGHGVTTSWALNVLAVVFWTCKQLDRAQLLSERAVAMARTFDDPVLLGWWLINLACIHSEFGYRFRRQNDEAGLRHSITLALAINGEALALAEAAGDAWGTRVALANAAEYHIAVGRLGAAESMLERWELIPMPCGARTTAQFFYTRGQLRAHQGRHAEALTDCANALNLAEQTHNTDNEAHAARILSEIYESLGRFEAALGYFKRFHETQTRLAAEKTQRRARIAEIHYETERFKRLADQASRRAIEMEMTSRLDALTGIGNRRALDECFERLKAEPRLFCIAVVDLDHFKRINDTFSHSAGDEVLRRVAGLLRAASGTADLAVRLGGEEFVLVMRDVDLGTALRRGACLNAEIAAAPWAELSLTLRVTASIGVASHLEAPDPAAVMARADVRLYAAKAGGRDRVIGADPAAVPLTALRRGDVHSEAMTLRLSLA